ncbi:MAG: hypothetical protein ACT4QE_13975 [Anaerolineales bacterium]
MSKSIVEGASITHFGWDWQRRQVKGPGHVQSQVHIALAAIPGGQTRATRAEDGALS